MSTNDRLPPIAFEQLSAAQQVAAQAVINGPRGALYGPFVPLIRSPELMAAAQRMGEYLRYRSAIGTRLTELAILVTARQWSQQVEWAIHAPIARDYGIADEVIAAIAARQRPAGLLQEEALVYDFCIQLQQRQRVDDATYAAALAAFGEHGVVDLMGINGYYTFLAMVMNAAQTAVPASHAPPLPE
ncbi:carboxymuconolactone decarboxylase family protein [Pseudoduganella sp. FT25W]|uniref:Carboxymuconolactone decarboxylase family protein n=1 Tax=Duganella alba TaxID=2666081 RepID=A0A6L5QPD0_9BURK|nr:carboxymuconolactone decarboxylase family protein [Duganella alba]MRX11515.1 carboxymuconolactone decarboxylase family protein [Duganella alba]MRX19770.1 carboxymuconolactone decarboxylase family protein [Duganella alba]